ncbi:MAG: CBS domain-containing protein [Anaerolineae bacterium]|nr:CBS domain-containing protein [Anaerolineae bacterium]
MLVSKIMTADVITVTPDTSHREAFETLKRHNISQVPVLDKGKLVGIVSEEDLLSTQPSPATTLSIHEIYALLEKLKVRQFMTHPVYTVDEECPIEVAARVMLEHRLGCLPIVRGEELVGIVSETDIFKAFVNALGGGHEGLRLTLHIPGDPGTLAQVTEAVHEAGGNIISLVTWEPGDSPGGKITIKETGADHGKLKQALDELNVEVIDMREGECAGLGVFGKK